MGTNYPLNKRRSNAGWQWLIIGFLPGLLIGGGIVAGLLFSGIFGGFGEPQVIEVTREISVGIVVTSTPDPLATEVVRVITTTPEPTTEVVTGEITFPTEAPTNEVVVVASEVASEETAAATEVVERPTSETNSNVQSASANIPAELDAVKSPMVTVNGGVFQYGTTSIEILQAATDCQNRDGGQCLPSDGDDSTPQVNVELETFSIEITEVTFAQYEKFLSYIISQGLRHTTACNGTLCIQTANERPDAAVFAFDGANYFIPSRLDNLREHPVYGVTWFGANAYCQALGRRLPTEAEWEYAARSNGQAFIYPWGNNWNAAFANVRIAATSTIQGTVPVTSLTEGRNQLNLYNMAGNVAEWTNDWYDPFYYSTIAAEANATGQPVLNPTGAAIGTQRVLRGGSFDAAPFFARTFHRQSYFPEPESPTGNFPLWIGFRCAADGDAAASNAPASSNAGVNPSDLGVPATGDTTNNAQPTAPTSPEANATEEGGARG